MHFFCAACVEELGRFAQLCAAHDGVIDEQEALALDEVVHRDEFHFGDEVALALVRRHEGARPCGRVFDERAGERYAGLVGVADGVRDAGIRYAGDNIGVDVIAAGECAAAVIAHALDGDALVAGGRVAVVDPQERADLHFFAGGDERLHMVGVEHDNFARAELAQVVVAEV